MYLSMNSFMRAQWESHLSSKLWRSVATRWLGTSRSCLDPHWLLPGSDSSGTSSPHPPWYTTTPTRLSAGVSAEWGARIWTCEKYLKHQRRSGVPSQFFPTVTISPARKDFRRQTGKERSMSKMVVAHCEHTPVILMVAFALCNSQVPNTISCDHSTNNNNSWEC